MASHFFFCDCEVLVVLRLWDLGHHFLNPGEFADIFISKDCWMLKQEVAQKTGIGWKVTAMPALMYSVLFYSSLDWLDVILSYITSNILLEFLMWTALFWDFTQHRLAVCYQHFGTSYESIPHGWSCPRRMLEHLGTHLYWEWCGQWLVLREHDNSNRVSGATRRWKGETSWVA